MTGRAGRDWRAIGCAAALAASIAFPLGLLIGGGGAPSVEPARPASRARPPATRTPAHRDVYSPRVASDPYVIEQQRRVLRALEASCRQSGRHCAEAEQAGRRIEEAEARR
ncbi:MAG TPA: hypothetical protein VF547_08320 [Allosphingosinicella sp.]|jgi:hypothetical protein